MRLSVWTWELPVEILLTVSVQKVNILLQATQRAGQETPPFSALFLEDSCDTWLLHLSATGSASGHHRPVCAVTVLVGTQGQPGWGQGCVKVTVACGLQTRMLTLLTLAQQLRLTHFPQQQLQLFGRRENSFPVCDSKQKLRGMR